MKKALTLLVTLIMGLGMLLTVSCAKTSPTTTPTKVAYEPSGTLTIWSFTDELKGMAAYYTKAFPKVKIKYIMIPTAQYPQKLTPALTSNNPPDVFAMESSMLKTIC